MLCHEMPIRMHCTIHVRCCIIAVVWSDHQGLMGLTAVLLGNVLTVLVQYACAPLLQHGGSWCFMATCACHGSSCSCVVCGTCLCLPSRCCPLKYANVGIKQESSGILQGSSGSAQCTAAEVLLLQQRWKVVQCIFVVGTIEPRATWGQKTRDSQRPAQHV